MYKLIDCEQGSDEWFKLRLGKITASVFGKVMTKTGKVSASSEDLINRAVAEIIMQKPDITFQSESMIRGNELEEEALNLFNFAFNYDFKKCGFMDSGNGYGCSPDGIDEPKRIGLELKCPEAHTHLSYLSGGILPTKYIAQVQGAMAVSGFDKWVFGSYHPDFPSFRIVVERDEKYITQLLVALKVCCAQVETNHANLIPLLPLEAS